MGSRAFKRPAPAHAGRMKHPSSTTGDGRLRVAAAQMVFAPTIEGNLERIGLATGRAAGLGADVILFPECATTGYGIDFGKLARPTVARALQAVSAMAARHRIHLLVGSPVYMDRRRLNALLLFNRAGRLVHGYAKCQLTDGDRRWFSPGNALSLFSIEGMAATAIICHERRYPELVRLPVMAGAQVVFHPNAGLDDLAVSKAKRGGRDGIPVRAFENAVYYVFANSVGPQGGGKWSAGDTKIVAPDGSLLGLANNRDAALVVADLDPGLATRRYAAESLQHPRFLAPYWRAMVRELRRQVVISDRAYRVLMKEPAPGTS